MALLYYPNIGEIILCRYPKDSILPEMTKTRPVVVVTPRLRKRANLIGIVPLSTTAPDPIESHHCLIELEVPLPSPFHEPIMWAKCDMFSVVSLERLDRFKENKSRYDGVRQWRVGKASASQITSLRKSVLCGLGFDSLTIHL
jgi:mRNA interferase MazF